jgi:Tfp pilus assembly protein PilO
MEEFISKWRNEIVAFAVTLVLLYGMNNYLYKPKFTEMQSLKTSLKSIDDEIGRVTGGPLPVKDIEAVKAMIKEDLDDLSTKIPSESETPYLINNFIAVVGKGLNIDYNLIQPSDLVQEQKYKKLPLHVEFKGTYADLNSYLAQFKLLPVTIRVDSMELNKVANQNMITVNMLLSEFVMPGPLTKPPGEEKGYSSMADPFYAETGEVEQVSAATTPKGLKQLKYLGYVKGLVDRAIINDEVLKTGDSILSYKVLKIRKDNVSLVKNGTHYDIPIGKK